MDNNRKIPNIRFAGFTDAWEQCRLGDVVNVCSGRDYKHLNEGEIPVYGTGGYMLSVDKALSYDVDAIGIGRKGTIDKPYILKAPFWTVDTLFYSIPKEKNNLDFVYNIFQRINWKKRDESTGVPSLSKTTINVVTIFAPKYEEQVKVGSFFSQLDHLITLHQREYDLLVKTKKSYLQKMFPQKGEDKPEIRFEGFTEAWEQRKLGDIAERVTRKNKDLISTLPLTISAQDGLIDQNEFFNKTVASRDVSGYYLMKNGEFAYNKSYSNGYPWGAVKRLDRYDMGVLSTLYIIFKPTKVDSTFLAKYYDTDNWYKEVSKHAAEGARNHGLLNIAASDFFETELLIPSNMEEQSNIGDFFIALDNLITLHQRELNSLKNMKKSLLQQMFI